MKKLILPLVLLFPQLVLAQMTQYQKLLDFQELAALFSKRYAFYEWKRDAIAYDGLDLAPWLSRVRASKDDLSFFEICAEYVARYQDGHTAFELPTDFEARLGFSTDLYDGKVLIDGIDRKGLTQANFPAQSGDELLSIDGKPVTELMADFVRFVGEGNARTAQRIAAALLTDRPQAYLPGAYQIGDTATIAVRRQSGAAETYTLPWIKEGMPYTIVGPAPDPRSLFESLRSRAPAAAEIAPYLRRLRAFQTYRARRARYSVGIGRLQPLFAMPASFVQRMGAGRYDSFFSGSFEAGGRQIGFLRLPDFEYLYTGDLASEIAFFESSTDGLIIDIMHNPGGYGCAAEEVLSYLMPDGFHTIGHSIRATWDLVMSFQYDLDSAKEDDATDEEIAELQQALEAVRQAYAQQRGFTPPLPMCGMSLDVEAAHDRRGKNLAYTKPIMVLADGLSASAAEMFAAVMQDQQRALIYGDRTAGAGGAVLDFPVGSYMEAGASLAQTILVRKNQIATPDYPPAPYIENIGVRPDRQAEYMTTDNLLNQGKQFVADFSAAMVDYIQTRGQTERSPISDRSEPGKADR